MKIIYGTTNNAKYIALKKIFKNLKIDVDIETLKDIGFEGEIIEDGKTFEENSEIKALAIKKFCDDKNIKGRIIITDDSGLCVDILNGEPGVYSARYASENATQEEILQKLLKNMEKEQDLDKRTANFVSVLTAILDRKSVV